MGFPGAVNLDPLLASCKREGRGGTEIFVLWSCFSDLCHVRLKISKSTKAASGKEMVQSQNLKSLL